MRRQMRAMALWVMTSVLVGLAVTPVAFGEEPSFHFYTEEYPPITFSAGGKASGLGTEVVEEILRRTGLKASIDVTPWARGYSYATTLPLVGLFVTTRTPEREPLFRWVGPISVTHGALYILDGAEKRPKDLEEARTLDSIAVPREWYLHQILRAQGFTNLQETPEPVTALKLLIGRHVAVAALDEVTLETSSREAGVPASRFQPVLVVAEARQFLAFSRDTSDDVVERCQQALDAMKSDGSFAAIYRRWLPAATPPGVAVPEKAP